MASVRQRLETLKGWLIFMDANKKRKSKRNPKNKFKIRIKSKKTGKIVEINLRCKQKLDKIFY